MASNIQVDAQCWQCVWLKSGHRRPWCDVFQSDRLPPEGWRRPDGRCTAYLADAERARVIRQRMRAGRPIGEVRAVAEASA